MRKFFSFVVVSVDGYHEAPDHSLDWNNVDAEFNEFAAAQLDGIDTLVFGRATYEGMASFWPTAFAIEADPEIASRMNDKPKIVVSRTLTSADWANTRVVRDNLADEFTRLKQQPGKDIAIFGSSKLTVELIRLGLIDEVAVMVMPVLLGDGTPLFQGLPEHVRLTRTGVRPFDNGNTLSYYRPTS
ncbi:MAG TPA: dihydrofolate reductase family protein [Pseudonocardiaceae bacterium]|jgi:dihydrofolate reductase|nr:dihydrofolate reductase family protein [Pseudonocardiaceae bacterium]